MLKEYRLNAHLMAISSQNPAHWLSWGGRKQQKQDKATQHTHEALLRVYQLQQVLCVSAGMTRDDGLCRAGQVTKCLELKRLVSTWDAFFNDLQYNKCLSYNLVKIPLSFLQYVLGSFYTLLRNIFKRFSSILYTFPAD